jgi:hypothetical protein
MSLMGTFFEDFRGRRKEEGGKRILLPLILPSKVFSLHTPHSSPLKISLLKK